MNIARADLAKIGAATVATLYAIGFLVVTFHLSQFGVAPVTWLRPQYLLAGIWCLLPPVLLAGGLAFTVLSFAEPWIRDPTAREAVPRTRRIYRHTTGTIMGILSLVAVFIFISVAMSFAFGPPFHLDFKWRPGAVITLKFAALLVMAAVNGWYAVGCFSTASKHSTRLDRWLALVSVGVMGTLGFLAFTVMYVHSFSVSIYSFIPSAFGGGRPQRVVFLVDSNAAQTASVITDSSGTRSVPYNLLLTTDSSYVVESPAKNEMAIEFRQDSVRGMIVLR
jgi:hypothetical protein